VLRAAFSEEADGDQHALIEALVQALNRFIDRLNKTEARVESDPEHKT